MDDGSVAVGSRALAARTAAVGVALEAADAAERGPRRKYRWFSAKAARAVLARVAAGEAVHRICADPAMPAQSTVYGWAKHCETFATRLARAREAAGWVSATSPGPGYDEAVAREIFARLCAGEPLYRICRDPAMPSHSTVYRWRETDPDFAEGLDAARRMRAEQLAEMGWDIAAAVQPQDAYATHVKLMQLRWNAGVFWPAAFGRHKAVAHETPGRAAAGAADRRPVEVIMRVRHFQVERRADGWSRVVCYLRSAATGELERDPDSDPPWSPPGAGPAGERPDGAEVM